MHKTPFMIHKYFLMLWRLKFNDVHLPWIIMQKALVVLEENLSFLVYKDDILDEIISQEYNFPRF